MQFFHVKDIGCKVDIGIYRVFIGLRGGRLKGIQGLCRDAVHDFGFRNGPANNRNYYIALGCGFRGWGC